MCAGDQCCPGFAGSGGSTFPCPSASSDYSGCVNNTKVTDCTSSGTVVTTTATATATTETTTSTTITTTTATISSGACKIGATVRCPGSGAFCAGDQCCPGFAGSGGSTFPCPSASSGFSGCGNNTKVTDCTSSGTVVTAGATSPASAVGDPHLQNIHGEKFDLMKPGKHLLIHIPRRSVHKVMLRVDAEAKRMGTQCADIYFQDLNITGA